MRTEVRATFAVAALLFRRGRIARSYKQPATSHQLPATIMAPSGERPGTHPGPFPGGELPRRGAISPASPQGEDSARNEAPCSRDFHIALSSSRKMDFAATQSLAETRLCLRPRPRQNHTPHVSRIRESCCVDTPKPAAHSRVSPGCSGCSENVAHNHPHRG